MTRSQAEREVPRRRRVRTPSRLQMEATECGAAALGIVLAHYGRWVPLEELRDACGISRDGSNAKAIKIAAEEYGLEVRAKRCEIAGIKRMRLPLVVFWSFSHFLVVEGWGRDGWHLNDPGCGRRTCSPEEFSESFTGIVLEMKPGPGFRTGGKRAGLISRLAAYLTGSRDGVVAMGVLGLLLIAPQVLLPGLARLFVDSLSGGPPINLTTLLGAMVLAGILQAALVGLQGSVAIRLSMKLSIVLQSRLVARLLQLPAGFHAQRGPSALAARARRPAWVADTVSSLFSTVVVGVITSITAVVVLMFTFPPAGGVALVALIVIMLALVLVAGRSRALALRLVREEIDVATVSSTALSQIEVVKASGAEDNLIARWSIAHNRFLAASQALGERMVLPALLPGLMLVLANTAVTIVGLLGVLNGQLTLGGFVAVQTLLGLALAPAPSIVSQFGQANSLAGDLDQIDDVLNTPPDRVLLAPAPGSAIPAVIVGDLLINDLTFGYDRHRAPLIESFSLHVPSGRRVALVGKSGCGKSTVSRLVVGWFEPWSGEILIDGHPRDYWPAPVLARGIGIVEQDPMIFAGTVRDNLTMWDPTIGEAEIVQAAIDAGLHDEIAHRPGSYEAMLTEGGANLSGGQRQRLEIARALVRNPALLVLDEATSALDAATEARIDAAMRRRGTGCLIIAHRLSTVRDADEILVLDAGRVIERGTHAALIAVGGRYRELVTA